MITLLGLQFTAVELVIAGGLLLAIILAIAILVKMPKKEGGKSGDYAAPAAVRHTAPAAEEDEIIAVLAAAVAAATGMAAGDFRVASYQQLSPARGRSVWSRAGRREQMSRSF